MAVKNIVPGEYIERDSFLHRVDPRIKFIGIIILIIAIFLNSGFESYVILGGIAIILFLAGKIRFKTFFDLLKPILILFIILFIINWLLLASAGAPAAGVVDSRGVVWGSDAGAFTLHSQALYRTLYISLRVYLIITFTTVLTITTKPLDITIAISDLLFPLKYIRFPVDEVALMLAIALRFIPTLIDEADKILKAQASRGVDFGFGSIQERGKATIALTIPLFVSAFQKADDLANALDARGYSPQQVRTRYSLFKIKWEDYAIIFLSMAVLLFCILEGYYSFNGNQPGPFFSLAFIRNAIDGGVPGLGPNNNPLIYPFF